MAAWPRAWQTLHLRSGHWGVVWPDLWQRKQQRGASVVDLIVEASGVDEVEIVDTGHGSVLTVTGWGPVGTLADESSSTVGSDFILKGPSFVEYSKSGSDLTSILTITSLFSILTFSASLFGMKDISHFWLELELILTELPYN